MKQVSFIGFPAYTLMVLIAALTITGCSKGLNTPNPVPTPTPTPNPPTPPTSSLSVSGIKPTTGAYNTAVTITGTGFSSTLADDSVYFNGVAASLYSANDSQLVAVVQKYTGTGDVVVKVAGVGKTGPLFTYIWTALENRYAGAGNNDVFTGSYKDGDAATAGFFLPGGLALDNSGNVYVYDIGNNMIRKITPPTANADAQVSTLISMGSPEGPIYANMNEFIAGLAYQNGVFFTGFSSLWISGGTVTPFTPAPNHAVGVTTLFPPSTWSPLGVTMDRSGNLYAASNNTIVIIYESGPVGWAILGSGLKGDNNGQFVYNVDNEAYPPGEPSFGGAVGVAVDTAGNIYVADAGNNQIRKITPGGVFSTFAGSGTLAEKDGTGTEASFAEPTYISIDGSGNLYVADQSSSTGEFLRKITPAGVVSTLCSGCLSEVGGIVVDPAGHNVYSTEYYRSVVDQISFY
jgi:hypothetical protein